LPKSDVLRAIRRHRLSGWVGFVLLGVVVPPLTSSEYYKHLEVLVMIYLLLILGMHLLSGIAGQVSFGQSAFMGIGAYAGGLTLVHTNIPYVLGALVAIGFSAVVALILGPVLVKLLGDYFVIATIALVEVVYLVLLNSVSLTGGPLGLSGIPQPGLAGKNITTDTQFYYLVFVINVIVMVAVLNISQSRVGRGLTSIRDDELAAGTFGVRVRYYKVVVLATSAGLAGLSGLLFASFSAYLNPVSFDYNQGVTFAIIVIVGGLGSLPGAVLATVLVTLSPELLRSLGDWRLTIYGAVLAAMMVTRPQGLLGRRTQTQRRRSLRNWRRTAPSAIDPGLPV